MKYKKAHVILSGILFLLTAVLAVGCGKSKAPAPEKETQEKDWNTLEEELRPCIVRISCGGYQGSGVVWEMTEKEVTVISAGHLLKNDKTCRVECYAGILYDGMVTEVSDEYDIGFAVIPAEEPAKDGVNLTAAIPSGRNAEELIRGEELVVYGSKDYAGGDFVKGYLTEAEMELDLPVYGKWQKFLIGGLRQEEAGSVDSGMSGGGVFDKQGTLLGILAGGDGEENFLAVPVWDFIK